MRSKDVVLINHPEVIERRLTLVEDFGRDGKADKS
jgi:hypothetical protein